MTTRRTPTPDEVAAFAFRALQLRSQLDDLADDLFAALGHEPQSHPEVWAAVLDHLSYAREYAADAGWTLDDLQQGNSPTLPRLAPHPNVLGPGVEELS